MAANDIRTRSPSTNVVVFGRPGTSLEEARRVAKAAKDAFKSYQNAPLAERKAIVQKALDIIDAKKDQLARELTMQMGRPIAAGAKEIETMRKRAEYLLSIADKSLEDIPGQPEEGFCRVVRKKPLGPVFISSAWNVGIAHHAGTIHLDRHLTGSRSSHTSSQLML